MTAACGEAGNSRPLRSTDTGDLHLIVEGTARRVRDEATLRRASGAFKASYWRFASHRSWRDHAP